jgi:hypothetical protein
VERNILTLKFKWRYGIVKRLLKKPVVPIGKDKLENVFVLATRVGSELKKDGHGEVYVDRAVNIDSDSRFEVFGPFKTPER